MSKVQSVDRALEILEILSQEPRGLGVTALSHRLDVAKSTTHRLLNTLLNRNFVMKDENDYYKLGTQVLFLSNYVIENFNIIDIAKSKIKELSDKTNETIHLVFYDNNEVVYIDKAEPEQTIRMHSRIGKRGLMHCTGVGKAILAFMNEEEAERVLKEKGMKAHTPNTITDLELMKVELQKIRSKGFSIDNVENEEGIRCIASPIFDHHQNPIAAISISGPESRVTLERIDKELIDLIKNTAKKISLELGSKNFI